MDKDVAWLVERLDRIDVKRRTHFFNGEWSLMDGTTSESEAASTIRAQAAEIEDLTGKLEVAMTIVRGAQAAHDAERQHRTKLREAVEALKQIEWSNDSKWQSDCARAFLATMEKPNDP